MRATLFAASLALASCGTVVAPPDAAPPADRPPALDRPPDVSATADTDRDGLCDLTEVMRRTDLTRADTDGDGLLDSFELRIGSDPLSGRSPFAADRVLLREGSTAFATVEHLFQYQGVGDVVSATALDRTAGLDGARPSDLWDFTVDATDASPAAFVRAVAGPRFVGVLGMVVLRWRMTLTPRASTPMGVRAVLGCRRAYETQIAVKQEGGDILATRPIVLELAPPEGDAGAPAWPTVSPEGLCLPARCF
ncbi:MAG: thrombospondin type 3 repeat-containing protein [Polyangiales bacterium]